MVCIDSAALNSGDGPDFAPQLCNERDSREAGSCADHDQTFWLAHVFAKTRRSPSQVAIFGSG